jgi:hypothetical protein
MEPRTSRQVVAVAVGLVAVEVPLILTMFRSWETLLPMTGASFFRNNSVYRKVAPGPLLHMDTRSQMPAMVFSALAQKLQIPRTRTAIPSDTVVELARLRIWDRPRRELKRVVAVAVAVEVRIRIPTPSMPQRRLIPTW